MQDCRNSSALAVELLQSCTKPLIKLIKYSWNQFPIPQLDFHAIYYQEHCCPGGQLDTKYCGALIIRNVNIPDAEMSWICFHLISKWFINAVIYIYIQWLRRLPSLSSGWMRKHDFYRILVVVHQRRSWTRIMVIQTYACTGINWVQTFSNLGCQWNHLIIVNMVICIIDFKFPWIGIQLSGIALTIHRKLTFHNALKTHYNNDQFSSKYLLICTRRNGVISASNIRSISCMSGSKQYHYDVLLFLFWNTIYVLCGKCQTISCVNV